MINTFSESRTNAELKYEYSKIKIPTNIRRLPKKELILLEHNTELEKKVNEIPHLCFIAKEKNKRSYFLNDDPRLNPKDYKSGDIIVPETGIKYEVKSFTRLTLIKAKSLISQYKDNNFIFNPINFNIVFNEIDECTITEFKEELSNGLKIFLSTIKCISVKELQEEVKVKEVINLYDIDLNQYHDEYEKGLWSHIENCHQKNRR